jgi:hypothetical protein
MEADTFGCIGDTQHGDALAGDETLLPQSMESSWRKEGKEVWSDILIG